MLVLLDFSPNMVMVALVVVVVVADPKPVDVKRIIVHYFHYCSPFYVLSTHQNSGEDLLGSGYTLLHESAK